MHPTHMFAFHLYAFSDGDIIVITRGQSQEQAMSYACRSSGQFERGRTIFPVDHLPIDAAKLYDENHRYGWLHRRPQWLERVEHEYAVRNGLTTIFDDPKYGYELEPFMYQE